MMTHLGRIALAMKADKVNGHMRLPPVIDS